MAHLHEGKSFGIILHPEEPPLNQDPVVELTDLLACILYTCLEIGGAGVIA